jgi:hypothetical protein
VLRDPCLLSSLPSIAPLHVDSHPVDRAGSCLWGNRRSAEWNWGRGSGLLHSSSPPVVSVHYSTGGRGWSQVFNCCLSPGLVCGCWCCICFWR